MKNFYEEDDFMESENYPFTDEMLKKASDIALRATIDSYPDPSELHHDFSPKVERNIMRIIGKKRRSGLYRVLRSVACLVLVSAIAFALVLSFKTEVRAAVFGWVREQFASFDRYYFDDGDTANAAYNSAGETNTVQYVPTWIPDDFEFVGVTERADGKTYRYADQQGISLNIFYRLSSNQITLYLPKTDGAEKSELLINGNHGIMYIFEDAPENNAIVWIDSSTDTVLMVSCELDKNELINIAINVKTMKNAVSE